MRLTTLSAAALLLTSAAQAAPVWIAIRDANPGIEYEFIGSLNLESFDTVGIGIGGGGRELTTGLSAPFVIFQSHNISGNDEGFATYTSNVEFDFEPLSKSTSLIRWEQPSGSTFGFIASDGTTNNFSRIELSANTGSGNLIRGSGSSNTLYDQADLTEGSFRYDFGGTNVINLMIGPDAQVPEFNLPTGQDDGSFLFDTTVGTGFGLFDPVYAIGYDYKTGAGDPLFHSFFLPNIGDNEFDLLLWDGQKYVFDQTILGGVEYSFDSPVDRFRILGIEEDAMVDPTDEFGFVTGLKFESAGRFTGTMTPLTSADLAPVPLPAAAWLLLGGLAALLGVGGARATRKAPS